jgi:hypothetical protein
VVQPGYEVGQNRRGGPVERGKEVFGKEGYDQGEDEGLFESGAQYFAES